MNRWISSICCLLLTFSTPLFAANKAFVLDITGNVGPATEDYLKQNLGIAIKQDAKLIILRIKVSNGLEYTMRNIDRTILKSPIPIIAYVAPQNAYALGVGPYIVYASHIAAMAPDSSIGKASPLYFGRNVIPANPTLSDREKHAVNEASDYLQKLATLRHRNTQWATATVQQSAILTATEALQQKVINVIADDIPQLLQKVNGQSIQILGKTQRLNTKDMVAEEVHPDWRYQFLSFVTNPNVVYLLILLAIYGLFFEIANPGLIVPGTIGLISLLLAIYAFQLMPINYTALTLLFIGIAFMTFEMTVSSFGVVGVGGFIAFILGSLSLLDSNNSHYQIDKILILSMSFITLFFFFIAFTLSIKALRKSVVTGREGLIRSEGIVINCEGNHILVNVLGEIWQAQSVTTVEPGEKIRVLEVKGLLLIVEPLHK